jgi:hypothetical protein
MAGRTLVVGIATAAAIMLAAGTSMAQPAWPPDEVAFIKAAQDGRDAFQVAHTDLAKGDARGARTVAICGILQATQGNVANWVGQITLLAAANNGAGVLGITIAEQVSVGTWPNPLSDVQDRTLIAQGSPVFAMLQSVKLGDVVLFSGQFVPDPRNKDCARDMNSTYADKLLNPAFAFQFTAVIKP